MTLDSNGLLRTWQEAYDALANSTELRLDWSEAIDDVARKYQAWLRSINKRCLACGLEIPHTYAECQERASLIKNLFAPKP